MHQNELNQLIGDLGRLKQLSYTNLEITKWEDKALELIEMRHGKDSKYYQSFFSKMNLAFWRPSKGDPRGSASRPEQYQMEYIEQLSEYRSILESL